jgi:hypothetical protein
VLYIGETRSAYKVFVRRINLGVEGRIILKPVTKKKKLYKLNRPKILLPQHQ